MYRDAQATNIDTPVEEGDVIIEESSEDESQPASASPDGRSKAPNDEVNVEKTSRSHSDAHTKNLAKEELRGHELMALACCFLGPILGAYLLHTIRSQLSRPSEGLVSNYNLTIFLLAAEFRPAAHLVKLIQARTLHLQRTVNDSSVSEKRARSTQITALEERISELETHLVDLSSNHMALEKRSPDTTEVTGAVNKAMQPQLDALNRAVRRYEKRAITQGIQTDARIQDLERRLQDALSLAAVAAESGRRSGLVAKSLESIAGLFMLPLQTLWRLSMYPVQAAGTAGSQIKTFLLGPRPTKKKRLATKHEDHGAFANGRIVTKNTKR